MFFPSFFQAEELRARLEERNKVIEKKTQVALQANQERNRISSEFNEIRDHMDIKDRKISVLQRKVWHFVILYIFLRFLTFSVRTPNLVIKNDPFY